MMRALIILLALGLAPALLAAQRPGFTPEIGTRLDTGAVFRAASGQKVTLAEALDGRPALLILGYHTCPNLCGVVQTQVADALGDTGLESDGYRVLFVSVSDAETPGDAAAARARLAEAVPEADLRPWRFLTGPGARMARRLGMDLLARQRTDEFVHPISVLALTPSAQLARALPVATFRPEGLRLALVEASEGKLGGLAERLYLLCAGYDATQGQYTPVVMSLVRAGGIATLALLGAALALMARRRR